MKKLVWILAVFGLFLLAGCSKAPEVQRQIPVSIREGQGFTVENNGQKILPGEDAVFLLRTDPNMTLASTDYENYACRVLDDGRLELTIRAVPYPTRVTLQMTSQFVQITYDPNDGAGQAVVLHHDVSGHLRPNTSNGVGMFTRDGYTLESWNTKPDGSGERIGLGSRVTASNTGATLYAQWAKWSEAGDFDWAENENGLTVSGYRGEDAVVAIPAAVQGKPVTVIASGAFQDSKMTKVILPPTMMTVEEGAFSKCSLQTLTLFDNIESIADKSFKNCTRLQTLQINAVEKPYGILFRRESCYADKVDMLIQAQGQKKIVFYGGCSVWYNLDGTQLSVLEEQDYRPINMGLNGLVNSCIQLEILNHFLEPGDIFFHTPEISSERQMMLIQYMDPKEDDKLWCGLEFNYDLVAMADLRTLPGCLDSFCSYLQKKQGGTDYNAVYEKDGNTYLDSYGCIPFFRGTTDDALRDRVYLDPSYINANALQRLKQYYDQFLAKGVTVYMSYACINMDDVPEDQRGNQGMMEERYQDAIAVLNGPVLISRMEDYLFVHDDFYDTNYHLLSQTTRENTKNWLRDLQAQMERDGLWGAQ